MADLQATHRFDVCNVNASAVPRLARMLQPYRWLAHPKLKIAVVGWTTPDTAFLSSPGAVTFSPIVDSLKVGAVEQRFSLGYIAAAPPFSWSMTHKQS
jgi:2',3'-cyclic-nucleotide 2'-phosphodiesterase (5'-nucleotidase family)